MTGALWPFLLLLPVVLGFLSFHRGPMPGEPADARFLDVDGVRVRFTDTAEGTDAAHGADATRPAAVLLHGFASAREVWEPVIPALARSHRVISLDLKGFGWTDRPAGDYSPVAQARLVLRLLEQRGIREAAFVAHSWGSSVALAATLLAPERVTRVALYDAWVYEEQLPAFFHWARADGFGEALFSLFYKQNVEERLALAFHDRRHVTRQLLRDVDVALERPGTVAAALAAVRGQRFAEMEHRYATIRKPALLLWGREDAVAPLRFGERLARELPEARLLSYAHCGHFPMIEAPAASNRDLVCFLNGERESRRSTSSLLLPDDDDDDVEPT